MSFELTIDEGRFLVKLARETIETFLEKSKKKILPGYDFQAMKVPAPRHAYP